MSKFKKATLSKGRIGWCASFLHPLLDAPGNQKRRVRRGLGERDAVEAQKLVDQLNTILSNPELWSPSQRQNLESKFDPRIVAAFMDGVEPDSYDPLGDREREIPLPGANQGFAKAQAVGATAAGKTTFMRQILGTDPATERFPSTSAAKTTICDIEIVMAEGPFKACVSFLPLDLVRQLVADCVSACAFTFVEGGAESEAIRRFFEHSDQKFRQNYLLGHIEDLEDEGDEISDGGSDQTDVHPSEVKVTPEDRKRMSEVLRGLLAEIRSLANRLAEAVAEDLGQPINELTASDRQAFEELAESELLKDDGYHEIVDKIVEQIEERFDGLDLGTVQRGRDGWPTTWTLESAAGERTQFIQAVNRFSSNYAPHFGKLLTPLVQGIRVRGPFNPKWNNGPIPRLVLLDGQGIGHTADTTSSVSTTITKRYSLADVILLVDNAAQPLQAASCAVLSSVVSSGLTQKLLVCFTHFDEVRGDNLPDAKSRKNHVISSFDNAASALGKILGRDAESSLKRLVPERLLFLSNIHHLLKDENKLTRNALESFQRFAEKAILPPEPDEFHPVYDVANLIIAIQRAAHEFHEMWMGVLGFASVHGVKSEHWTRVKALSRYIGFLKRDEYDTLMPVADLMRFLRNHIYTYLALPLSWEPYEPRKDQDEKRQRALDNIRQKAADALHSLSAERLIRKHLAEWANAYNYRGTGSTRLRAKDIRAVYESGAPVPAEMPGKDANAFMLDVRVLVKDAVIASDGKVVGWDAKAETKGELTNQAV